MVSLKDLDLLDDGSYDRIVEEEREKTKDESKVLDMVFLRILKGFKERLLKEKTTYLESQLVQDFGVVPRKKRSSNYVYDEEVVAKKQKKETCCKQLKGKENLSNVATKKLVFDPNPPVPAAVRYIVDRKGGNNVMLVITKQLTITDVNEHHGRFAMPVSKILGSEFLKPHEKYALENQKPVDCVLVDPCLRETHLRLKKWIVGKNCSQYNLISQWRHVLEINKNLVAKDLVQLWSFRCNNDKLWLVLLKI